MNLNRFFMDIEKYEWQNVRAVDIGFWANMNEGWRLLCVVPYLGSDTALMYRPKQTQQTNAKE